MPKAASKLKSVRRQGITILMLLVALGAYFAAFVPAQRTFLTRRYVRVLADMGNQIQEAVANLGSSLANATRRPPNLAATETAGSLFLTAMKQAAGSATGGTWEPETEARAALELVPNLELTWPPPGGSGAAKTGPVAEGLSYRVLGQGKASWLGLEARTTNTHLMARSDLKRLIGPIVDRGEFDDVLLLDGGDSNGLVRFQFSSAAAQVLRLAVPSDRSFQTNLANLGGASYLLFSQPLQLAPPVPAGQALAETPAISWTLCGLVRADRFAAQTRSVDYTVLVLFTFLALLLVLSWPFLNVWSLGLRGGLRPGEIFLVILSAVTVNAFLVLLVMDLVSRQRLRGRSEEQLEALAGAIETNLRSELRHIARQLEQLNDRFLSNAVSQTQVLNQPHLVEVHTAPYPHFGMAVWIERATGQQLAKWTVKDRNTPLINVGQRAYFRLLAEGRPWSLPLDERRDHDAVEFCLEPIFSATTGEYLATFSRRPQGLAGEGVRTDDWRVISTLDCRLLSLVNAVVPAGFGFCVVDAEGKVLFHTDERRNLRENLFEESDQHPRLRAAVTGRQAGHVKLRYASRDHAFYVRPLRGFPWSLATFRDGRVVGTALVETVSVAVLLLLGYCGALAALLGLVYLSGTRRLLAWLWPSSCRPEAYGLLTVLHATLAVLFGAAIQLSADGFWGCAAAVVIPPTAILAGLFTLSRGRLGSARLRLLARRSRLRLPRQAGYVATVGSLLVLVATLPGVAFFKAAFVGETRLMVRHAQLRLAHDHESRAQRLWLEIHGQPGPPGFGSRPLRVAPPPGAEGGGESPASKQYRGRTNLFGRRLANTWDTYTDFYFDTQVSWTTGSGEEGGGGGLSWWPRCLLALRPHYNEEDAATRSVAGHGAEDGAWYWTRTASRTTNSLSGPRLELVKARLPLPGSTGTCDLRVSSAEPEWGRVPSGWWLVFLFLLGLPFLMSYILADKVLLLRMERHPAPEAVLDPGRPGRRAPYGPGKYLLLGPPRSGKSRQFVAERFVRLPAGGFRKVDLRVAEDQCWLEPERTEALLRDVNQAVVVDSLDYRHEDPEFSRRKLAFLRQLVLDEARTVVVASSIHPLHFGLGCGAASGGPTTAEGADSAAWVDVLACFRRLYTPGHWERGDGSDGQTSSTVRLLHRSIWRTCSPAEQEVLSEVAQGRLVSSTQPELAPLLERGLLRRDPSLQPADEAFRRFILTTYCPGAAAPDAVREAPGLWQSLKGPAVTGLVVLAAFLFLTQKEMWNNTVAGIGAFVAGIGALAKVFELLRKEKPKSGPPT